jgi:hypothetical protein
MLIPSLPHMHFFLFSDTCYLGSNGSTKFLESRLSLIPSWRVVLVVVLECYEAIATMQFFLKTAISKKIGCSRAICVNEMTSY